MLVELLLIHSQIKIIIPLHNNKDNFKENLKKNLKESFRGIWKDIWRTTLSTTSRYYSTFMESKAHRMVSTTLEWPTV